MTDSIVATGEIADACLRCGYDLRGIDNAHACPECGLLAERSRRVSDELHNTRPRWLRTMAVGVMLILLSAIVAPAVVLLGRSMMDLILLPGFLHVRDMDNAGVWFELSVAAFTFLVGVFLLTVREHYPPADLADARSRFLARCACAVPLIGTLLWQLQDWLYLQSYRSGYHWQASDLPGPIGTLLLTIGCVPIPWLIFHRLRGVAKRARSAHLAEHCMIAGIGGSASLLFLFFVWILAANADEWFHDFWTTRSDVMLTIVLVVFTAAILFLIWSVYLLVRFAGIFWSASRQLRYKWRVDDRALTTA